MRYFSIVVCALAATLVAACSQSGSPTTPAAAPAYASNTNARIQLIAPQRLIVHTKFHGRLAPATARRGIYVAEFFKTSDNIIGYRKNNKSNGPPICTESSGSNVGALSTDASGHLMLPNASGQLDINGRAMCAPLLTTLTDPYGTIAGAVAVNALHGKIFVFSTSGLAVCRLASESCTLLSSPGLSSGSAAGIAIDRSGNCYADGFDMSAAIGLWIWPGCKGTGTELTSANGFSEPYSGGMNVDNRGRLLVVSLFNASLNTPSTVTVYTGCITGTCTTVGGPFNLQGESASGGLNVQNEHWVAPNMSNGMVDVYSYGRGGRSLTYMYSFNNGLQCVTYGCESAIYSPSSPK